MCLVRMLDDRTPRAQAKSHRRITQQGCPVVFAPRSNSNPLRTPWRFELRHVAVYNSFRSLLSAALAAIERLFWSSSCTLAPNVLSSFPSLWCGLLVLQNRSIPLLESASSEFPLAFSLSVPLHRPWWR